MEDPRSQVWGGATLGLFVGLILGFFVGSYWTTVLYAVLIGAASGVVDNIFHWLGGILSRRNAKRRARSARLFAEEYRTAMDRLLQAAEILLREHSPADFEMTPNAAAECIDVVGRVEEEAWWRVAYDSLDSFYAAHEARHPDIRLYAAVRREVPMVDALEPPAGIGGLIARRIARRRAQAAG